MYNMVFGSTQQKTELLPLFGIDPARAGRYRDVWVERDGDSEDSVILALYTRNGGGNRGDYVEEISYLRSIPTFIHEADDDFDCTYATFRFRIRESDLDIPEEESEFRANLWKGIRWGAGEPVDTDQRWRDALSAFEKGLRS